MGQQFNDLQTLVTDQYIESMKSLKLKHIHEKKVTSFSVYEIRINYILIMWHPTNF